MFVFVWFSRQQKTVVVCACILGIYARNDDDDDDDVWIEVMCVCVCVSACVWAWATKRTTFVWWRGSFLLGGCTWTLQVTGYKSERERKKCLGCFFGDGWQKSASLFCVCLMINVFFFYGSKITARPAVQQ